MQPPQMPKVAKDIMVTKLVTLTAKMDAFEALGLLLKHKISGAPVVDSEYNLVGVFSEKCCMSMIVKAAYEQLPSNEIAAFMDRNPKTISEDIDILSIAQIFQTSGARRLPVISGGKLVGQISRRDVLRTVHEMMRIAPEQEKSLLYLSSTIARDDAPIA